MRLLKIKVITPTVIYLAIFITLIAFVNPAASIALVVSIAIIMIAVSAVRILLSWKKEIDNIISTQQKADQKDILHPNISSKENAAEYILRTLHKDLEIKHTGSLFQKHKWLLWRLIFNRGRHWKITANVYHRLLLRYTVVKETSKFEQELNPVCTAVNDTIKKCDCTAPKSLISVSRYLSSDKPIKKKEICPHLQSYHIATTDLFVEKAIAYLEDDYDKYIRKGGRLFFYCYALVFLGLLFSFAMLAGLKPADIIRILPIGSFSTENMHDIAKMNFNEIYIMTIRGITFYGMLITLAVFFWRHGKATMDQAELLRERRHALRQGRLFVHLNDGVLSIEELETAFNWNTKKENGFTKMLTEASAPLSGFIKAIRGEGK